MKTLFKLFFASVCSAVTCLTAKANPLVDCSHLKGVEYLQCKALTGALAVAGGIAHVVSPKEVAPGLSVKVKLPSGKEVLGKLAASVAQARVLKEGDVVQLSCNLPPQPGGQEFTYLWCDIKFPRIPPDPNSSDQFKKLGLQQTQLLGVSKDGKPNPLILEVADKLQIEDWKPLSARKEWEQTDSSKAQ